jgi:carbonic anhydrase
VDDIVRRLLPAVIATRGESQTDADWIDAAARQNVKNTCEHVLQRSPLIRGKVEQGQCLVVGAWYDLGSGEVELFGEVGSSE